MTKIENMIDVLKEAKLVLNQLKLDRDRITSQVAFQTKRVIALKNELAAEMRHELENQK